MIIDSTYKQETVLCGVLRHVRQQSIAHRQLLSRLLGQATRCCISMRPWTGLMAHEACPLPTRWPEMLAVRGRLGLRCNSIPSITPGSGHVFFAELVSPSRLLVSQPAPGDAQVDDKNDMLTLLGLRDVDPSKSFLGDYCGRW